MKPYNTNKNWVPFLTRPSTLLGASLWNSWYCSPEFLKVFGVSQDFLFIEEPREIVRAYRIKEQLDTLWDKAEEIARNPDLCRKLFLKGQSYNEEAQEVLRKKNIKKLKGAIEFFWKVAVYGTTVPYLTYEKLDEIGCKDKELLELGKKLRAKSLYPQLIDQIITPLALEKTKDANNMTITEILKKETNNPKEKIKANKQFIYQSINRKEVTSWRENNDKIVKLLEPSINVNRDMKGQCACPGKVKGTARVILKMSNNFLFNKGDILVTICSSPDFMPLISKAAAIVTDEGGITSHAAVISRELKIPCVIGTKIATKVFKDNDMIEVNATKGTVKKL